MFSVAVLIRYRTQGIFRIGSECDPDSDWKSDQSYSGCPPLPFLLSPTRVSLFVPPLFRGLRVSRREQTRVRTPHGASLVAKRFGLSCALFTRRYWGHRNFFLFLPLLKCFNFGRSLSFRSVMPIGIGQSAVQRLHASTRGLSQLATTFVASRAKPSTK